MNQDIIKKALNEKLKNNPFCTLEKAVYDILLESIITFQISPGTRLVESQLADAFGVSRSPIREAIQSLEKEGFVKREKSKKFVVEPMDLNEYNEIIEFRCILEPAAIGIASEIITEDELDKVKYYADKLNEAYKNNDYGAVYEYENHFHEFIIQCSHNRYIINAYKNIQPYLTRSRAAYLSVQTELGSDICAEEHYLIYNCLKLRNKKLTTDIVNQLLRIYSISEEDILTGGAEISNHYARIIRPRKDVLETLVNMHQKITKDDTTDSSDIINNP